MLLVPSERVGIVAKMADALALDISSDLITFPTYHINLDLPPAERWQHVVEAYKEELKAVEEIIDNLTTGTRAKSSNIHNNLRTHQCSECGSDLLNLIFESFFIRKPGEADGWVR